MRCNFSSSASNWQDKLVVLSTLSKVNALQGRILLEPSSNVTIVNKLLILKTSHFCGLVSSTIKTTPPKPPHPSELLYTEDPHIHSYLNTHTKIVLNKSMIVTVISIHNTQPHQSTPSHLS